MVCIALLQAWYSKLYQLITVVWLDRVIHNMACAIIIALDGLTKQKHMNNYGLHMKEAHG